MQTNQILVIEPYRYAGTWVFDDATTGLKAEPFVSGVPEIIGFVLNEKKIKNASKFRLLFSKDPFPGARELSRGETDCGGTWYKDVLSGMSGWLCPALFLYFDVAPPKLFCEIEAIKNEG